MTKVSVVILNYNGEKLLPQFLPSVIRNSPGAEIVVADNGSQDQSLALLKKSFPEVRVMALERNFGFCGGYNRALQQIKSELYVLLNSDIEVTSGWLSPLIEIFDRNPDVAACQPKILSYRHREQFEYAGAAGGLIDTLGYPFCRGRIFKEVEQDHGQYNDERPVFWASGACLMIRAEVYHRFGGLDEYFFAHMEEIDLCWKINRAGLKVFYSGKSEVYHLGAGTLNYDNPMKTYLNFRNGLIMIFKHFKTSELFYKLPLRIGLDWVASLLFLMKGEFKNFLAVVHAHFHFLGKINFHTTKRREVQKISHTYHRENIHPGMIVFDYYLRRKRLKNQ